MKLIIKDTEREGLFKEVDYVTGSGLVGTSIMSVHFTAQDCYEDHERFIKCIRESILPRISPETLPHYISDGTHDRRR